MVTMATISGLNLLFHWIALGLTGAPQLANHTPSPQQASRNQTPAPFYILTKVYANETKTPITRNNTVFIDQLIFDFQYALPTDKDPVEVTIYETPKKRFVLLDNQRKVRCEIDDIKLLQIVRALKRSVQENEQTQKVFAGDLTKAIDFEQNTISVQNQFLQYTAIGRRPDDDAVLQRYLSFIEPFTLLTSTKPSSLPPFSRMILNQEIKKVGVLPQEVHLKIKPNRLFPQGLNLRSQHQLELGIKKEFVKAIEIAKQNWLQFERVSLNKYRQIPQQNSEP